MHKFSFGKAINSKIDGWHWIEQQGMTVDMPNVLDHTDRLDILFPKQSSKNGLRQDISVVLQVAVIVLPLFEQLPM